jgi:hypothetical protein
MLRELMAEKDREREERWAREKTQTMAMLKARDDDRELARVMLTMMTRAERQAWLEQQPIARREHMKTVLQREYDRSRK